MCFTFEIWTVGTPASQWNMLASRLPNLMLPPLRRSNTLCQVVVSAEGHRSRARIDSPAASTTSSTSFSVCANESIQVSYCEGGR